MTIHRVYHIMPHSGGGWAVMESGSPQLVVAFHSKEAATSFARNLAEGNRPSKLVVHKRDQSIELEAEYEAG